MVLFLHEVRCAERDTVAASKQRIRDTKRALLEVIVAMIGVANAGDSEEERNLRRKINSLWEGADPYGACSRATLEHYAGELNTRRGASIFSMAFPIPV